jgi:hypothetical protein
VKEAAMKKTKQVKTAAEWKGPRIGYGRWNTDDPESPFMEFYEDKGYLNDKDGEVVGIYELVSVQRVEVRPALVDLVPPSRRRKARRP